MSVATKPIRRRRSFPALSPLRSERLSAAVSPALSLFEVAHAAGLSSYRLSVIERALDEATPEELAKIREAIARLAEEREPRG